jgi:hypothetical protein
MIDKLKSKAMHLEKNRKYWIGINSIGFMNHGDKPG